MTLHNNRNSEIVELLKVLKSTDVPKSVDSGEAITYLALKDAILDNAISVLDSFEAESTVELKKELCVDHQKLASAALERIFDKHTQVLRQKLKEAEEECEMWRKVTLFGRCRTVRNSSTDAAAFLCVTKEHRRSTSTQTDMNENPAPTAHLDEYMAAAQQWLEEMTESSLSLLDAKVERLCYVYPPSSPDNQSPLENSKSRAMNGSAIDAGKLHRASPTASASETCSPGQKITLKSRVNTPHRKVAPIPITPIKSPASKTSNAVPKPAVRLPSKRENSTISPRQDATTLNQVARSFDGDGHVEPLYVLHTLQLKARNSVYPSIGISAAKIERCKPLQHLPQL